MSAAAVEYRLLEEQDWPQWKVLRLEALKENPTAFGSSYEEECDRDDPFFQSNIKNNRLFGAFIDKQLVSTVGLLSYTMVKMRHRGLVYGVYTTPSGRGKGITKVLMEMTIEEAKRKKMAWLQLIVTFGNDAAIKLYQKLGFQTIGTEPRALEITPGFFVDQYIMALNID